MRIKQRVRGTWMVAVVAAGAFLAPVAWASEPEISFEAGAVWQKHNTIQIPNAAPNTRFALTDITGEGPFLGGRVTLNWPLNDRHRLRFIVAPLRIDETGTTTAPIVYQGQTFASGEVKAKYHFDSYRASWLWRFHDSPGWIWDIGATLNVRNAEIRLSQGSLSESKRNTGLVPLLALEGQWRFASGWRGIFDFEGLGASQGRAIDVALKVAYDLTPNVSLNAGYRILDGGADNEQLYTFARFDQVVVGLAWKLH